MEHYLLVRILHGAPGVLLLLGLVAHGVMLFKAQRKADAAVLARKLRVTLLFSFPAFAVLALSISVVSFPLLLDRDVGPVAAVKTSLRAVMANPVPMAAWGLVVAVSIAVGSVPFFVGLAVVMPILGHATWHLYRRVIVN